MGDEEKLDALEKAAAAADQRFSAIKSISEGLKRVRTEEGPPKPKQPLGPPPAALLASAPSSSSTSEEGPLKPQQPPGPPPAALLAWAAAVEPVQSQDENADMERLVG